MSAMTEKILSLTLEIIYLLTGEDYIVVKKSDHESRGCRPGRSPQSSVPVDDLSITCSLSHNRNDKKILKITKKIAELLSGEVSVKQENVAAFSLEEEEYAKGRKDLHMDTMMKSQQPISSEGSEKNSQESCDSVPCSQDCAGEENKTDTQDYQGEEKSKNLRHKEDEPDLDVISAVLSVSREENTSNPPPGSLPSDCTTTFSKYECFPADRQSSPTSPHVKTRSIGLQEEERHSKRQMKVAETVTERLRAQHSYIPPHKRRKGNPVPLREEANSPVSASTGETGISKDVDVIMNMEDTAQTAYQCSHCQECFGNAADFITHQALHKAESWFPPFYDPASLVTMDFNGKQKPFVCLDCGKCFMYRSAFTRHQRIHTGEKPFVCFECGKSFSQNTHLAKHRKNHSSIT